ncbi:hypothetical protein RJ639_040002 [Escallonia herrerae]|uniref:Reverse transcriptase Ty1/copia-type domain-containing protein n=1 Tax=Escallonia herrerae TaxID=1293975 RepID=A0AA88WNI9_9ASTE|nr:hypothetical protein RJ639_040002 [Escallonia herrerae]
MGQITFCGPKKCVASSKQYTTADLAHQYQLHDSLYRMKQDPDCPRKIGAGYFPQDCPRNPKKWSKNSSSTSAPTKLGIQHRFKPSSHSTAVADDVLNDSSSSALLVNGVAEIKSSQGIILVLLYVDDMIITCSDLDGISILKQDLNHHSEMKDLDTLCYFLGLEVSATSDGYYLSQAKYASDLISHASLTDSKTASSPLKPNVRFTPLDGTLLRDPTLYRTLVDSLVYLTVTRPDILQRVAGLGRLDAFHEALAGASDESGEDRPAFVWCWLRRSGGCFLADIGGRHVGLVAAAFGEIKIGKGKGNDILDGREEGGVKAKMVCGVRSIPATEKKYKNSHSSQALNDVDKGQGLQKNLFAFLFFSYDDTM